LPVTVRDVMTKKVISIDENKSVKYAAEVLKKYRKGALIVLKKHQAVGILTDSDIIKKVVAANKKPSSVKVKTLMSKPIIAVKPGDSLIDAARKLKRNNIKRLPVITEGSIVGIISATDIAVTSPEMLDLLESRLKSKENPLETPMEILEKETSGICESCGSYADDLQNINEQWLCEDCREELE